MTDPSALYETIAAHCTAIRDDAVAFQAASSEDEREAASAAVNEEADRLITLMLDAFPVMPSAKDVLAHFEAGATFDLLSPDTLAAAEAQEPGLLPIIVLRGLLQTFKAPLHMKRCASFGAFARRYHAVVMA